MSSASTTTPLRRGQSIFAPPVPALGAANTLLLARARQHSVSGFAGPLSLKHVVHGRAAWQTGRNPIWVDSSTFLILNDGESYSLEIDAPQEVETCCVFFQSGFLESLAHTLSSSEDLLLADPFHAAPALPFISRLHRSDHPLISTLYALRQHALSRFPHDPSPPTSEERFLALGSLLLHLYDEMRLRIARLPATRLATRIELLQRLERGREFLHAYPTGSVSLARLAAVACLSPFHFHRAFTRAFGQTPHAYLSSLRLARARDLLARGLPVTEVCFALGFSSLGSFSSLFRRRFGRPPSSFYP